MGTCISGNTSLDDDNEEEEKIGEIKKCVYKWLWNLFYTFCFLAGQHINFEILKIPSSSESETTPSESTSSESETTPSESTPLLQSSRSSSGTSSEHQQETSTGAQTGLPQTGSSTEAQTGLPQTGSSTEAQTGLPQTGSSTEAQTGLPQTGSSTEAQTGLPQTGSSTEAQTGSSTEAQTGLPQTGSSTEAQTGSSTGAQPQTGSVSETRPVSSLKKLISVAGLILFAGQITVYAGYVVTAMTIEGFTIANYSFIISTSSTGNDKTICMLPEEHWKFTTAITIGAFAAFFSYSMITCSILIPVNTIRCCCKKGYCTIYKKAFNDDALSPYKDDPSSKMTDIDTWWFFANYIFLLVLFSCSFISSIIYALSIYDQGRCWLNALYLAMIVLHLSSQFCAIHTCFLFSKIVYKVTNKLKKLAKVMKLANFSGTVTKDVLAELNKLIESEQKENEKYDNSKGDLVNIKTLLETKIEGSDDQSRKNEQEKVDKGCYYWLQKMDQDFIKQVQPMLELFGVWFIVHWILFALTTVFGSLQCMYI